MKNIAISLLAATMLVGPIGSYAANQEPTVLPQETSVFVPLSLREKAANAEVLEVIVGLRASGDSFEVLQDEVLDSLPKGSYSAIKKYASIPFIALHVTQPGFDALLQSPLVAGIEEDISLKPALKKSVETVWAAPQKALGYTGEGQIIAILDTGFDVNEPMLQGSKIVEEACFSTESGGETSLCTNGGPVQHGSGSAAECTDIDIGCDHGTHVAAIAAGNDGANFGVARDAQILAIKVYHKKTSDCDVGATCLESKTSDITAALVWLHDRVTNGGYDIAAVNISSEEWVLANATVCETGEIGQQGVEQTDTALNAAAANLRAVNVPVVASSGNDGSIAGLAYPSCLDNVISVGATDAAGALVSTDSNSADFLDLLAPGTGIESPTFPRLVTDPGTARFLDDSPRYDSTSIAAAHVSGAFALLRQADARMSASSTVDQLLLHMKTSGTGVNDTKNNVTTPLLKTDAALVAMGAPDLRFGWLIPVLELILD